MLVEMKCPSCAGTMNFDDSRDFMFCPYCGNKVANLAQQININQQVTVSGTVNYVQDRSNDPNLYISFNTSDPTIVMETKIVSDNTNAPSNAFVGMVSKLVPPGAKHTYVNGQTMSFHLSQGPHRIVFKIGKKSYNKDIVIPPSNSPVRIYASFSKKPQITIDQPSA